jgi:hypothetical protein
MVGSMAINGFVVGVDKPALWNAENNAYYYQLFLELWIYNSSSSVFQYHNRYVHIWLNMTS